MIELLRFLEANGFSNFIASGGGRDFMRPITAEMYGIPPDRVIGSSVSLAFRDNGDANGIVAEMAAEVLPIVKNVPVLAGVNGTDPYLPRRPV